MRGTDVICYFSVRFDCADLTVLITGLGVTGMDGRKSAEKNLESDTCTVAMRQPILENQQIFYWIY